MGFIGALDLVGDLTQNRNAMAIAKAFVALLCFYVFFIRPLLLGERKAKQRREELYSLLNYLRATSDTCSIEETLPAVVETLKLDCYEYHLLREDEPHQLLAEILNAQANALVLLRKLQDRGLFAEASRMGELVAMVIKQISLIEGEATFSFVHSGPDDSCVEEFYRCQETKIEIVNSLS